MRMVALLALSNVLLFILHVVLIFAKDSSILEKATKLPTSWGALIGSIIGLSGVAYTAHRGFQNIIAAQDHRAGIEKLAREHQYDLENTKYKQEKRDLSVTVANAIAAELSGILDKAISQSQVFKTHRNGLYLTKSHDVNHRTKIILPTWNTPIWDKFVGDVGMFGAPITADLITVYARCKAYNATEAQEMDVDTAILTYKILLDEYETWRKDIIHVTLRLVSYTTGQPDPGPLLQARHRRGKGNKFESFSSSTVT